jgi:hypothetical protein
VVLRGCRTLLARNANTYGYATIFLPFSSFVRRRYGTQMIELGGAEIPQLFDDMLGVEYCRSRVILTLRALHEADELMSRECWCT